MRTIDDKRSSKKPVKDKPKRPDKGIKKKDDAYPEKPDFDSREHYKNVQKLQRELNPTSETKPKSPRVNEKHYKSRIEDLEELNDAKQKEIDALKGK